MKTFIKILLISAISIFFIWWVYGFIVAKKDVIVKTIVSEIGKGKGEKYEISVAMDIPGGKVVAAKDECSNIFAGVDLVEAKLTGQIRRYKLEMQPHRQKRSLKNLFIKRH